MWAFDVWSLDGSSERGHWAMATDNAMHFVLRFSMECQQA
jgi:hypothetical protein